jgi:hypothetical protein
LLFVGPIFPPLPRHGQSVAARAPPAPPCAGRSSGYKALLSASRDEPRDGHTPPEMPENETTP